MPDVESAPLLKEDLAGPVNGSRPFGENGLRSNSSSDLKSGQQTFKRESI